MFSHIAVFLKIFRSRRALFWFGCCESVESVLPQGFRELPKQSTVTYVLCDALVRFTTSRPSNRYRLAALPARVSNLGRLQPASVPAVQAQQSSFSEEKFSHEISDFAPLIPDCGTQSGRLTRSTSSHSRSTFFPVRERESSSRTKQNQCEQRKKIDTSQV